MRILVLLTKGISETFENEAKEQKGGFLGKLLSTLGASLLGYLSTGKGKLLRTLGASLLGYLSTGI